MNSKILEIQQKIKQACERQKWQELEILCQSWLQYEPENANAHYHLAIARAYMNFVEEAIAALHKTLQIQPNHQLATKFLQQLQQQPQKNMEATKERVSVKANDKTLIKKEKEKEKYFNRYRIISELGRGGMGCVYKAKDETLDRYIALKVVLSGEAAGNKEVERFMREAKATAHLHHPNIVAVHDIGVEKTTPFFTMDFIDGQSFKSFLQKNKSDIRQICQIMIQVGEALHYAHKQDIIHRDMKPANIMLTEKNIPIVMDFGLAKVTTNEEQLSKTGDVLGTPAYMPPEQADGKPVSPCSDVYSLGATLYEALTGRPPFQGQSYFNIIKQIFNNDPVPLSTLNPDIPVELEAICLKSLEKLPGKRYKSAALWVRDLRNFLDDKPTMAKPPTFWTRTKKTIYRHRFLVSTLIIIFLLLLIGGTSSFVLWQEAEKQKVEVEKQKVEVEKQKVEIEKEKEKVDRKEKAAQIARKHAEKQRKKAINAETTTRATLYRTTIKIAGKYYQDGEIREVRNMLTSLKHEKGNEKEWEWNYFNSIYKKDVKSKKIKKFLPVELGWEWHYLNNLVNQEEVSLVPKKFIEDHPGDHFDVYKSSISFNGKLFALCYEDRIDMWDVFKQKFIKSFTYFNDGLHRTNASVFSPDSSKIAMLNRRGFFVLWDIKSGKQLKTFRHKLEPTYGVFRRDGMVFLCSYEGSFSSKNTVVQMGNANKDEGDFKNLVLWNVATGKKIWAREAHLQGSNYCDFGSRGRLVASCGVEGVRLWNIYNNKSKKAEKTLSGHNGSANICRFSPDNKHIISAGKDSFILVWDIYSGRIVKKLQGHMGSVSAFDISKDGTKLLSGYQNGTMILWELKSSKILRTFYGHSSKVTGCFFVSDTKAISSEEEGIIKTWDISGFDNPRSIVIDKKTGNTDTFCTISSSGILAFVFARFPIVLWDTKKEKYLKPLQTFANTFDFSPDNKKLVVHKIGTALSVHSLETGRELLNLDAKEKVKITSCAYGLDGQIIIAAGKRDSRGIENRFRYPVYIWDAKIPRNTTKTIYRSPMHVISPCHAKNITNCIFTKDKRLITAGVDNFVRVWDFKNPKTPTLIKEIIIAEEKGITHFSSRGIKNVGCSLNADQSRLAVALANIVYLIDLQKGRAIAAYREHSATVTGCSFLGDDRIVSASEDGTIKIWRANLPKFPKAHKVNAALLTLSSHKAPIRTFASRNNKLVSIDVSGIINIWDLTLKNK